MPSKIRFAHWGILAILLLAIPWKANAFCNDTWPTSCDRDDVLILVNDNSSDSLEVGQYYATERNISSANIVHVRVRPGFFINWSEFESLRDQILRHMQQSTLFDSNGHPLAATQCSSTSPSPYYCKAAVAQIREHTRIRYLVTTKGLPTRLRVDGIACAPSHQPCSQGAPTSVDEYLMFWLVNFFTADQGFANLADMRLAAFGDGRQMRGIDPAKDHALVVGRIDGLTVTAAKKLVDRAIEAEQNGIYGKYYGNSQWQDSIDELSSESPHQTWGALAPSTWENVPADAFGNRSDARKDCLNVASNSRSETTRSPQDCTVKILASEPNTGSDRFRPGNQNAGQHYPDAALAYLGFLDTQATAGNFRDFMNWRRNPIASEQDATRCKALCADTKNPQQCRQRSEDPFKEINTECVGVADGFIGFNLRSFPVSYLAAWPTGWVPAGGGDIYQLAFPEVRANESADLGKDQKLSDADHSLWFANRDQVQTPQCYADSQNLDLAPEIPCRDRRTIAIRPSVSSGAPRSFDPRKPQRYRVRFWYKGEDITRSTKIGVHFRVRETNNPRKTFRTYPTKWSKAALPLGDSNWTDASRDQFEFTIDPTQHNTTQNWRWDGVYDKIQIEIVTERAFEGAIGIDAVSIEEVGTGTLRVANPTFDQGHRQTATGDYAANFLSRLNGTAFWGSMSHHHSGGYSFASLGYSAKRVAYFMRGLPLADSVWLGEGSNDGILYGDPLYSPIAVRIYRSPDHPDDSFSRHEPLELFVDAINGTDPTLVETRFTVDVCAGESASVCDRDGLWSTTPLFTGAGGDNTTQQPLQLLGNWSDDLAPGAHVLRLAVSSRNASKGLQQTFYDYYPIWLDDEQPTSPGASQWASEQTPNRAIPVSARARITPESTPANRPRGA